MRLTKGGRAAGFLSLVLSVLFLSQAPSVAAEDNLKAVLQARYGAMKAAMAAHDAAAIRALLAPDFRSVDISGATTTAAQMIAQVNGLKPDPNKVSETTLASVTLDANKVTVDQRYEMKTLRPGKDGAAHAFKLATASTDIWVRSGDVWLLQETVTREMSMYMDDKLIAHKVKA